MNKQHNINGENQLNNFVNMDTLVINLKNEDSRNLRLMKNFKWIYFVMIIVYTLLLVVNPDPELDIYHRISGLCYVVSFVFFWLIFRKYHKEYSEIDYSLPLFDMLTKAAERYKMGYKNFLLVIPPILLIDVGLTISFTDHLGSTEFINKILFIQAIYIPVICISGFIGYMIWKKRQKPLRDGALQLLKELKS